MSAFPRRPDSGRRTKSSAPSPGARGLGGIYRGWWVVSAPFLVAALNTGAGQYGFGVFIPPLESEFGWTRAEINFALSFTAAGGLLAPLIGPVIDRYGTKPVMAVSLGIIAASFLARPLMTDLLHWYALSFLQYVGYSAASMMCAGKLVGMWFQRRRGRAMGITAMGNNVGGIFAPPIMVAVLAFTGGDWRAVFVALGAMSAGLVLYTLAATRDFPSADDLGGEMLDRPAAGGSPMTGITLVEALRGRSFYALTLTVTLGLAGFSFMAKVRGVFVRIRICGIRGFSGFLWRACFRLAGGCSCSDWLYFRLWRKCAGCLSESGFSGLEDFQDSYGGRVFNRQALVHFRVGGEITIMASEILKIP